MNDEQKTETPTRTLAEIENDYRNGCGELGQVTYQIAVFESNRTSLVKRLSDLNHEAAALKQAEQVTAMATGTQTDAPAEVASNG